jgi:hypothetical protein
MKICFGKNNMDQKINLIFFDCSKSVPLVNGLIKNYTQSNKFEVESLDNINEINQLLQTSLNGILFFKVENKVDLQKAVSILKAQKKLVKKGLLKPACITNLKNKKMETILSKYGCVDILEPETATKTVSFKLDFWSKPISAHLEQVSREEKLKLKKQQETKEKNEKEKPKEDFLFVNSLDLESDFWIIKHKNDCKKILRRWLVRILGPSPFIGNWVELQARPGDKLPTWKFVLKDPNNTDYIKNEGAWYFYGSKPEFDWKINRWSFSSDLPHLYFYTKDQKVFSRFKFINGSIEVCENSDFALAREEMILETCDAKYNFDAEKNAQQESKDVEGADEQDDLENLKGKASTDQLNHDPLSGKVNPGEELSEAERKKAGYSEDPIPGHMGGKASTDELNDDPLSGKVNPGEELSEAERKKAGYSEGPIPGHMGGKSSTDQLNDDPLSGKVNPSEELSEAERKKAGYSEDPIPGHMGGKSSTDQLDGDPLSGQVNPGEELSEAERKKAGYSEDPIPGHMGGKSSTDQLDGDPLSGQVNPGEELSEAERKKAGYSEDPIPGHMGGEASTDQLDGDPLSGKVNPSEELSVAERKKAGYSENPIPGHMGSKASTDQLDDNPLSGELDSKNTHKEAGTPIVHSQEEDKNTGGHSDVDLNHGQRATPPQGDEQQHDDLSEYGIMKGVGKTHQHDEQEDFDQENFENTGPDLSQIIDNAKKDSASSVDYDPNAIVDNSLTDFDEEGQKAGVINYNEPSSEKEEEILDALGGGLTKSQSSGSYEQEEKKSASAFTSEISPEKNKEKTQLEELNEVFANEVNVNLESGELKVVLKQKTNIGNDITFICEFEDFYEDELIVKAPLNSLATQTRVAARVSLFYNGHKAKVECLGTIEEKESLNENQETLIINIEKIDLKKYNEFIELYQKRQGNINDFLSMAKGY